MNKILSRKFLLLFATYVAFVVFFALGMLSEKWFCGSLLAMSLFYYVTNVWQKKIFETPPNFEKWEQFFIDALTKVIPSAK